MFQQGPLSIKKLIRAIESYPPFPKPEDYLFEMKEAHLNLCFVRPGRFLSYQTCVRIKVPSFVKLATQFNRDSGMDEGLRRNESNIKEYV